MKTKKTIKIDEFKKELNRFLLESSCNPEGRRMVSCFAEKFLMDTNNYKGFGFYKHNVTGKDSDQLTGYDDRVLNDDETRIFYF